MLKYIQFAHSLPTDKEILTTIGANIREIRKAQKLTQGEVEDGCGLPERHLTVIERGEVEIGILKAIKIAAYFKVQLSDIYYLNPEQETPGT